MTKAQIKKVFREHKVQLGNGTVDQVQEQVRRFVVDMAGRCKDGNVKRLTPELFWVALGKYGDR